MDYKTLADAGNETYSLGKRPQIQYPQGEEVEWYGFKRHNFQVAGCNAFIVEPPNPAPGLPWCWCLQWAEAFVPRTPALKLLERGFHHVHIDLFSTYLNPDGIRKAEAFYELLQGLGFHKKAALIGLSYGGLFSFRYAAEHPETVGVIYADAPLCRFDIIPENRAGVPQNLLKFFEEATANHAAAYNVTIDKLASHPLAPINNMSAIARAKIPILAVRSGQDQSVIPEKNIDLVAEALEKDGGNIEILRRDLWGHHPHGLDDPRPLVDFILQYYPPFEK